MPEHICLPFDPIRLLRSPLKAPAFVPLVNHLKRGGCLFVFAKSLGFYLVKEPVNEAIGLIDKDLIFSVVHRRHGAHVGPRVHRRVRLRKVTEKIALSPIKQLKKLMSCDSRRRVRFTSRMPLVCPTGSRRETSIRQALEGWVSMEEDRGT